MILATYKTSSPEETIELGRKLGARLQPGQTVLLYGDLGAGKTHFAKGIALGLGVEDIVKSPTFTYVQQYSLEFGAGSSELFHYDLYRFAQGDDVSSIGFWETISDEGAINVVEWADRLELGAGSLELGAPNGVIIAHLSTAADHHEIAIQFQLPASVAPDMINEYYEKWSTPMHVRGHCEQVAKVGVAIGEAFVRLGEVVDLNLIYTSAMLHDMCRVCDFKELDRNRFEEDVTDEKWQKWNDCRKQFEGMHHADIASDDLKAGGYFETAEVIRLHRSTALLDHFADYNTLEKKIVYYADKRVKHTEVVDLAERFRDGKARYGKYNDAAQQERFDLVEVKTNELENELFASLDVDAFSVLA